MYHEGVLVNWEDSSCRSVTGKNLSLQKCHEANWKSKVLDSVMSILFYGHLRVFQAGLLSLFIQ